MTQAELDAGAAAVIAMANQAGFGAFITLDQARALAAVVIRAADALRTRDEPKP